LTKRLSENVSDGVSQAVGGAHLVRKRRRHGSVAVYGKRTLGDKKVKSGRKGINEDVHKVSGKKSVDALGGEGGQSVEDVAGNPYSAEVAVEECSSFLWDDRELEEDDAIQLRNLLSGDDHGIVGEGSAMASAALEIEAMVESDVESDVASDGKRDLVDSNVGLAEQWIRTIESSSHAVTKRCHIGTADILVPKDGDRFFVYSSKARFDHMCWALLMDATKYNSTLYMFKNLEVIILRCAPVEMYVAVDLHVIKHMFQCIVRDGDDLQETNYQVLRHSIAAHNPNLSVLRVNSAHFQNTFMGVKVNFGRLFRFVLDCNTAGRDQLRDGSSAQCWNPRYDLGVAGLAYCRKEKEDERAAPRDVVCGRKKLDAHEDGLEIRRDLGKLMDCAVKLMDRMQEDNPHMGNKLFDSATRNKKYASQLTEYLQAGTKRVEWLTIQIKCLDRGDVTNTHTDEQNCCWVGYNVTGTLCFMFRDFYGIFWSLKIIINSRKVIGDYLIPGMLSSYVALKNQLNKIDNAYWRLTKQYKGDFPLLMNPMSARNFRSLFLDDNMPWQEIQIGNEGSTLSMSTMKVVAAPQRHFFLSLAVSALRMSSEKHNLSVRDKMKFALLFSYQSSYLRTYYVMKTFTPSTCQEYYKKMVEVFGKFKGGKFPRFSPCGLDIGQYYIEGDEAQNRLNIVVNHFFNLIKWVNRHTMEEDLGYDGSREVITTAELRSRVLEFVSSLGMVFQDEVKPEIAEFKTLLLLQLCSLAGVGLKAHPILCKLVYIASGTGSHAFLHGYKKKNKKQLKYGMETDDVANTLGVALLLDAHEIGNAMDCLFCESQGKRSVDDVYDVFVQGQDLFTVDACGHRLIKKYGKLSWERIK
jgi:hypothetical protein